MSPLDRSRVVPSPRVEPQADGEIRVAVDGTHASLTATDWGVREAHSRGCVLRLVHVVAWPHLADGEDLGSVAVLSSEVLAEAAARARASGTSLDVRTETHRGGLGPTLTALAGGGHTLVLGHRVVTGFAGMVLGSVAVGVATQAAGPVVVVPDLDERTWRPVQPRVVVGVDGPGPSARALAYGFGYAGRHGFEVDVVVAGPQATEPVDQTTAVMVAEAAEAHPDVAWSQRRLFGSPAEALAGAAADGALLVVGCRTRTDEGGSLLDSVSRGAIFLARCPVAVV